MAKPNKKLLKSLGIGIEKSTAEKPAPIEDWNTDSEDISDRVFIITDMCMYESNKKNGTYHPHAIEVVDIETGQVRYIQSGAKIRFMGGNITDDRNQDTYNKLTTKEK